MRNFFRSILGILFLILLITQIQAQEWTEKASRAVSKPSSRYQHSMTYDSNRNVVVLFGGMTELGPSDETWEWDGTTWTQRASGAVPRPSGRYNHAMVYDSNRKVVVLFGGTSDHQYLDETWEWDGTSWTQKASGTVSKPGPRQNHAMAFDSRRNVVILFGGYDRSIRGYPNDTWVWDGSTWTQKNLETKPSGRMFHSMAYDLDRNVVVMFGGWDKTYSDETWEWNGSSWSQVAKSAVTRPSGRWKQAMVFDKSCNTALMFGGESGGRALNDTWLWDGSTWTMKDPTTKPPARIWHKMAYDSERNVVVMFGGFVNNSLLNDTWEYNCRAGTETDFYFGDELTDKQANMENNHSHSVAVGSYPPNAWGVHDMHGNVVEWVNDGYVFYSSLKVTDSIPMP